MLHQANSGTCVGSGEDFWQKREEGKEGGREERGRHRRCFLLTRVCGMFCSGGTCRAAKLVAVRKGGLGWWQPHS